MVEYAEVAIPGGHIAVIRNGKGITATLQQTEWFYGEDISRLYPEYPVTAETLEELPLNLQEVFH